MRWFWIDRFDEFVRARHATAVKNVSLAEEHMHDHFPGAALMPNSLIVEGMAQTAGLLVADAIDYNRRAEILDLKPTGSLTKVTSTVGDKVQGQAELFFAHLEPGEGVPKLFEPHELLRWLDQMHIYDVGRDEAGNRLVRPEW
jgi:3-hydroxyacyl-[acyl-carrier-protein] dehydratase